MNEFIYGKYKQFLTALGDVMVLTRPPSCTAQQILDMTGYLDRGNVICRFYSYYLDSILIPGEFTHSGIIVDRKEIIGDVQRYMLRPRVLQNLERSNIIHFIAEGVGEVHPIDFVKDTDGFIILRPPYADLAAEDRAVERAYWHLQNKTEYDFAFNDPSKYYCHEGTVDCLRAGGIEDIAATHKSFGIGPFKFSRDIYLADDIIKRCKTEYVFRGRHRRGVAQELATNVLKLGRFMTMQKKMADN